MPKEIKKKAAKVSSGPHGPLNDIVLRFDVPGGTLLALHNALSYTLANREDYITQADDCDHCIKAMDAFRRYIAHVIENAPVYEVKDTTN